MKHVETRKGFEELDEIDLKILRTVARRGATTRYALAREVGELSTSTVYRRCERLLKLGLLKTEDGKITIASLGCLALALKDGAFMKDVSECLENSLGVKVSEEEVEGFLNVAKKVGALCAHVELQALRILDIMKEIMRRFMFEGLSVEEATKVIAEELGLSQEELARAFRLSLKIIAKHLPIILTTEDHKVALLSYGAYVMPVPIECKRDCPYKDKPFCPVLIKEVSVRFEERARRNEGS